jgi:Arc/MetJ-type ribon-helix-helix transcriptional regulator
MARALTDHYERVIDRLIKSGRFANRSEVMRAGLRALEEKYPEDYLHPLPLKPGTLERIYRKQSRKEQDEELAAARACYPPQPKPRNA